MLRRQVHSTLIWAAGSFGVALALGLPLTSNAVDQPPAGPLVQIIRTPRVTENGIELTVEPAAPTTRQSVQTSDDSLNLLLRAHNGSSAAATADFTLRMTAAAVRSPAARTVSIPQEIWADSGSVTLNQGETKTLHFTTAPPPPGQMIYINLYSGKTQITAVSIPSLPSVTTRPVYAGQ